MYMECHFHVGRTALKARRSRDPVHCIAQILKDSFLVLESQEVQNCKGEKSLNILDICLKGEVYREKNNEKLTQAHSTQSYN